MPLDCSHTIVLKNSRAFSLKIFLNLPNLPLVYILRSKQSTYDFIRRGHLVKPDTYYFPAVLSPQDLLLIAFLMSSFMSLGMLARKGQANPWDLWLVGVLLVYNLMPIVAIFMD